MLLKCDTCQEFVCYSVWQLVMDLTACFPVTVAVQVLLCAISGKRFHYLQPGGFSDKPPECLMQQALSVVPHRGCSLFDFILRVGQNPITFLAVEVPYPPPSCVLHMDATGAAVSLCTYATEPEGFLPH